MILMYNDQAKKDIYSMCIDRQEEGELCDSLEETCQ